MRQGKTFFTALLIAGIILFSGCTQPPTGQASLGSQNQQPQCSTENYTETVCEDVPYQDQECNSIPYTDRECTPQGLSYNITDAIGYVARCDPVNVCDETILGFCTVSHWECIKDNYKCTKTINNLDDTGGTFEYKILIYNTMDKDITEQALPENLKGIHTIYVQAKSSGVITPEFSTEHLEISGSKIIGDGYSSSRCGLVITKVPTKQVCRDVIKTRQECNSVTKYRRECNDVKRTKEVCS